MKYQALRSQFFSLGGWGWCGVCCLAGWWGVGVWGGWSWDGWLWGGGGGVGGGWEVVVGWWVG